LAVPRTGNAARERALPELRLELDEKLDAEAVARARIFLDHSPPEVLLILDFGGVRDFDPAALAGLFSALLERARAPRVALRGLCDQQIRLLRYLGLDVASLERRRDPLAEVELLLP
jgi:hypothetical protein